MFRQEYLHCFTQHTHAPSARFLALIMSPKRSDLPPKVCLLAHPNFWIIRGLVNASPQPLSTRSRPASTSVVTAACGGRARAASARSGIVAEEKGAKGTTGTLGAAVIP